MPWTSGSAEKNEDPRVTPTRGAPKFIFQTYVWATRHNPVQRGLVKNPSAWMWSSFLFYEKGQPGLVEIDPVG
jgi:hypothetical protein